MGVVAVVVVVAGVGGPRRAGTCRRMSMIADRPSCWVCPNPALITPLHFLTPFTNIYIRRGRGRA